MLVITYILFNSNFALVIISEGVKNKIKYYDKKHCSFLSYCFFFSEIVAQQ